MLLYFKGCTASERLDSISNSTEEILKQANVDYEVLDNENCCGSVLLRTGFKDEAKELMTKNINDFKDKTIVTSCAGCYKTLKEDYKDVLGIDLDVIHISELILDLINQNKLKLNFNKDLKVTYHDPCHLGRHSGVYEAPREVIKNIAELVEMKNIKEQSRCCGSGGGVKSAYGDLANSIATLRIEEAEDTDADLIVTACPFCKLNLSDNSDNLEVLDLSEFVYKALNNDFDVNSLKKDEIKKED
ncbi:MAG: heterodisulfide reductase-related iron-sulfur binding cluster [Methanobacteriaceae archaeon]|nr:heterodisulfide reductase-related iron-sulfur binding cluster [Methanobacteriaceae archaeon]